MQTLSRIDDFLDRLQKSGRFIEMKAQTGESDETSSSDSSYVCPCTFLAVLYKDIADEFKQVSIKHFYNNIVTLPSIHVKDTVDFKVFNGYIEGKDLFTVMGKIQCMDDKRTLVAPNRTMTKDFNDIFHYFSKECKTVFVNAFIILHHWARHDAMKGRHTDQLLWQTKHDFSPYDKFYQCPELPDRMKHIYENLKSEDFTLTNCLRRWFYDLCEFSYRKIYHTDDFYEGFKEDMKDKIKRCNKKRTKFDDLDFKDYFRKRFHFIEEMESVLRKSIIELNSLLTGAGNESSFPDPVYAAIGREDGTEIYQELIARARVIFKNAVLAAFPSSCFTKPTNIERMVSGSGVIDVEPFVKLLMDEFNALCIPKKLMSIYSDLYGVIREWIVGLVDSDQRDHIRTEFIEFVGYSDSLRYNGIDPSEIETLIKNELRKLISIWSEDTVNCARNALQRNPYSSFSKNMDDAHIFSLFADQVNCLLRNCEFFLENKNLGDHCGSLYSMLRDSIKEALSNIDTDDIFENSDSESSMRWSLKRGLIRILMTEAHLKLMSKPVKSLQELSIEALAGEYIEKTNLEEYTIIKNLKKGKMLLPGQYKPGSVILINDRDGVGVATFNVLWHEKIYDSNDLDLPRELSRYKNKFKEMRMCIKIPEINYMTCSKHQFRSDNIIRDIDDVEFVKF